MTLAEQPRGNPDVMDIREAAAFLGVAVGTLRQWMATGLIPHERAGDRALFRRQALLDWLDTQERERMGGEGPCRLPELAEE